MTGIEANAVTQRLNRAATLVEEAIQSLDVEVERCETCHINRYRNFQEYNVYQQLESTLRKLRRFASWAQQHAKGDNPCQ